MHVVDNQKYHDYQAARAAAPAWRNVLDEYVLPAIMFGSIGAIAWAIRGTDGWGGIDGTVVPGMAWGILWYYMCHRRGVSCYGVPFWLGMGIALGGELGYGQYVSWIRGLFNAGEEIIHISPWLGWLWFGITGIGWGAPGGAALAWSLSERKSATVWLGRIIIPAATAYLGWIAVQTWPGLFFPNHNLGIYDGEIGRHLDRTIYTNTQNFTVVSWWLGSILVAVFQRDWLSLKFNAIVAGGFGPGFALAAIWCLGYGFAAQYIDWWKMWELSSGFNLGMLYVIAFGVAMRHIPRRVDSHANPSKGSWFAGRVFEIIVGSLFIMTLYLEQQFWESVLLALMFAVFMMIVAVQPDMGVDVQLCQARRGRVLWIYSVMLFIIVTYHGATSTLGKFLETHTEEMVSQYSWPVERFALFLPVAIAVSLVGMAMMTRALRSPLDTMRSVNWRLRLTTLTTVLGLVGAVSIWPSKIGVVYALMVCFAIGSIVMIEERVRE